MKRPGVTILLVCVAALACATSPNGTGAGANGGATALAHDVSSHAGHDADASHRAAELAFLFPDGDDKGWSKIENGMGQHDAPPDVPLVLLPAATRTELLRQLALTLEVVKRLPTAKDAEAAGYRRTGPFIPGLGTHYVGGRTNRTGTLTDADILSPSTIIYDGLKPDSPIAGLMYVSVSARPDATPEGFAGPNDRWHYHMGVCMVRGSSGTQEVLGFDGSITESSCRSQRGNFLPVTQHMVHVWTAPGYTSPLGVFSNANPAIRCADGTYHQDKSDITNTCKARQ